MKESQLRYMVMSIGDFFNRQRAAILILPVLVPFLFWSACQETTPRTVEEPLEPPPQPASGPGGSDYRHAAVKASVYGQLDSKYWLFEPTSPDPDSAPLIVFNHGWLGMNPYFYGGWIDHLVRRGNIVVYPRYQTAISLPAKMTDNAITSVKDAIQRLRDGTHVIPQLEDFAIVGHSLGGVITANMAALGPSMGLPEPKAVMVVTPGMGETAGLPAALIDILTRELDSVPATALMLVIICSEDTTVDPAVAKQIFNGTTDIPLQNKDFITMLSDYHGESPLIADHRAPLAGDERYAFGDNVFESLVIQSLTERIQDVDLRDQTDVLDYYGFWKLFDGLTDAAFYGRNREYALGNTQEQRSMGQWSDGVKVQELRVTKTP